MSTNLDRVINFVTLNVHFFVISVGLGPDSNDLRLDKNIPCKLVCMNCLAINLRRRI